MPFYADYADAFEYHAAKIKPTTKCNWSGSNRVILSTKLTRKVDNKYIDLGYDFHHGYNLRQSKTEIPDEVVYNYLLRKTGMSRIEIDSHKQKLKTGMLFDEAVGCE